MIFGVSRVRPTWGPSAPGKSYHRPPLRGPPGQRASSALGQRNRPRTAGPLSHHPPQKQEGFITPTSLAKLSKADFSLPSFLDRAVLCLLGKDVSSAASPMLRITLNPVLVKSWLSGWAHCPGRGGQSCSSRETTRRNSAWCPLSNEGKSQCWPAAQAFRCQPRWAPPAGAPLLDNEAPGTRFTAPEAVCCPLVLSFTGFIPRWYCKIPLPPSLLSLQRPC